LKLCQWWIRGFEKARLAATTG